MYHSKVIYLKEKKILKSLRFGGVKEGVLILKDKSVPGWRS
jgi:hypothetical protein